MELDKNYDPLRSQNKWYKIWEESGLFKPSLKEGAPKYCICLPPPNVTGTLHMGHGFQHTLQDALIRYHRMLGFDTLWQPGTDHAGIATQIVVERELDKQNIKRKDLGREGFVKKVWEWKEFSGGTITKQMRELGASCDWSRERFTLDEGLSDAVTKVFVDLYREGLIYRGKRLVNWDVRRQTAVSDLEVVSVEEQGSMWYIRYPLKDDATQSITVATTRPETMLGDVAVAVNPSDERYKHLIGHHIILPLSGREIPIIGDDYVDAEFGTGCVKITPAHDFNDYEIGKRHNLIQINIFTLDGYINDNAPKQYVGLERFACRKQVVSDLEQQGYLVEVKPHKLMVPRGEKDDVIIEPMLTDQWFMNMQDMAKDALNVVHSKQVEFIPDNWVAVYDQWLENIQDWCISRQLWWGHRIPAYYDDKGNVYVASSKEEALEQAALDPSQISLLTQDEDVLDTWFSSALWCFSTQGWPQETKELQNFLPSSVLVTGFDIIFFWVARMIMLTQKFTGHIPFKQVYITGLIQDAKGQKMSKSKGNVIDPIDLINGIDLDGLIVKRTQFLMNPKQADSIMKQTRKDYPNGFMAFGADALRFTFAALATHGREIRFDVKRIEGSRNFCNKLWNAARFILMQVENHKDLAPHLLNYVPDAINFNQQWILSQLRQLSQDVEFAFKTYRFDILAQKLYEFTWNEFCDWYLELAKVDLLSNDSNKRLNSLYVLLYTFESILRMVHPLIPFISEELWQVISPLIGCNHTSSIMVAKYPSPDLIRKDFNNIIITDSVGGERDVSGHYNEHIKLLKDIVGTIRNLRAEMNVSPATLVPLTLEVSQPQRSVVEGLIGYIKSLAKLESIVLTSSIPADKIASATTAIISDIKVVLEVKVDKAAEAARITREIKKNIKELDKLNDKLNNSSYIERAPQDLVIRDKNRSKELFDKIKQLQNQVNALE
jgi:valyl-tRNA synthetase